MGNCFGGVKDRPLPILLILRIFMPGATGKSCRVAVLGHGGSSRMALVKRWLRDNVRGSRMPSLEAIYRLVDAFARHPERSHGFRCFLGGHRFSFSLSRSPVIIMVFTPNKKPTLEDLQPILDLVREMQSHSLYHRYAVLVLNPSNLPTAEGVQGPRANAGGDSARTRGRPQHLGQRPGAEGRAAAESPEKAHRAREPAGELPEGQDDGKGAPRARPE